MHCESETYEEKNKLNKQIGILSYDCSVFDVDRSKSNIHFKSKIID